MRGLIGRRELVQMIRECETLSRELRRRLDEKSNPWGIAVQLVEIRDVRIPQELEDAISRQARIILGTAETVYEVIGEEGLMVMVPSSAVETIGLDGMLATTALTEPLH